MVLYVSETEMIERYGDSLAEAASRCREFNKVEESERPEIFVKLVSSLKVGAGSCHQLAMSQMNPTWLIFRDTLEKFSDFCQSNIFKDSESTIWTTVANELDKMSYNGKKMASSRAKTRQEVLAELDQRQKNSEIN